MRRNRQEGYLTTSITRTRTGSLAVDHTWFVLVLLAFNGSLQPELGSRSAAEAAKHTMMWKEFSSTSTARSGTPMTSLKMPWTVSKWQRE